MYKINKELVKKLVSKFLLYMCERLLMLSLLLSSLILLSGIFFQDYVLMFITITGAVSILANIFLVTYASLNYKKISFDYKRVKK